MGLASVSRSRVAYIAEVTEGTTPAMPTFTTLRRVSGGMTTRKSVEASSEIQPDRNVRDVFENGQYTEGTFECEWSHSTMDDFLAAAQMGSWSTNVLANGSTERFFTIEETDIVGATSLFSRYTASRVNTFEIVAQMESMIRASVGFIGRQEALATTIISGATYTAANTEPVDRGDSVSISAMLGLSPLPECRRIRLNINNQLQRNMRLGSKFPTDPTFGQALITGEIELYFDDNAQMNLALAHSEGQLQFTLGSQANKKYTFNLPRVRILDAQKQRGGNGQPVIATLPFQAQGSAATASLTITRVVA